MILLVIGLALLVSGAAGLVVSLVVPAPPGDRDNLLPISVIALAAALALLVVSHTLNL